MRLHEALESASRQIRALRKQISIFAALPAERRPTADAPEVMQNSAAQFGLESMAGSML